MTQPEALYLAEILEHGHAPLWSERCAIAAELRRLHQFAEDQIGRATAAQAALQMTKATHALALAAVERQRDALLEALQALYDEQEGPPLIRHQAAWEAAMDKARAALRAALAQPEPVQLQHVHEWFSTGGMEQGQFRCIHCGAWARVKA